MSEDEQRYVYAPNSGPFTITITLNPSLYTIHRAPSDEPKLPHDYNPTRKHWQSPRYVPKRRK